MRAAPQGRAVGERQEERRDRSRNPPARRARPAAVARRPRRPACPRRPHGARGPRGTGSGPSVSECWSPAAVAALLRATGTAAEQIPAVVLLAWLAEEAGVPTWPDSPEHCLPGLDGCLVAHGGQVPASALTAPSAHARAVLVRRLGDHPQAAAACSRLLAALVVDSAATVRRAAIAVLDVWTSRRAGCTRPCAPGAPGRWPSGASCWPPTRSPSTWSPDWCGWRATGGTFLSPAPRTAVRHGCEPSAPPRTASFSGPTTSRSTCAAPRQLLTGAQTGA